MSRLKEKDVMPALQSLLDKIESGDIEVLGHHKDALKQVIEQDANKQRPMSAYFHVENWLYEQRDKSVEIKSAILWGALCVVQHMGCIDWDQQRKLYGEFMSKQMNLR